METVLLAWNPDRFPWGDLQDELSEIRRNGQVTDRWSVGNRTTLQSGSRFFLIRLGVEPRGLVGSGWITSAPFEGKHWDIERAEKGEKTRYSDIYFDFLEEAPVISMNELNQVPFKDVQWSTQMSGIQIAEPVALELEDLWTKRTQNVSRRGLEELGDISETAKNHASQVYVNRYERNARLRALCLAHYGIECVCCNNQLSEIYGSQVGEFIHVHHLVPLSSIPEGAEIDPISDLRPVCPNCHAVIHTRQPPYTVEEVREMIAKNIKKR